MKGKESGEQREEEEERELAKRECEAREKGTGEKNACAWKPTWPVGLLQARSPGPAPAYGRNRRQNGARAWVNRSENQRKQTNSRMQGEQRSEKHISVQAGRGGG